MSSINDFGINSSLSPFFVTYGIYDEESVRFFCDGMINRKT